MIDIKTALGAILKGVEPTVTELGFKPVYPDGVNSDELPMTQTSGRAVMDFAGENKAIRIEHYDKKITLLAAENDGGVSDADFSQIAHSLLDLDTADEKDLKYLSNEFSELITERFGKKSAAAKKKTKLPKNYWNSWNNGRHWQTKHCPAFN